MDKDQDQINQFHLSKASAIDSELGELSISSGWESPPPLQFAKKKKEEVNENDQDNKVVNSNQLELPDHPIDIGGELSQMLPPEIFQVRTPISSPIQRQEESGEEKDEDIGQLSKGLEIDAADDPLPNRNDNTSSKGNANLPIQRSEDSKNNPGLFVDTQSSVEQNTGPDLSGVNIHENSTKANDVGALAYTQGNDIHFASGQFNPTSQAGKELIGHELHHVKQQSEGRVQANTEVEGMAVNNDAGLEKEADDAGREFALGNEVQMKKEGNHLHNSTVNQFDPDPKWVAFAELFMRSFPPDVTVEFGDGSATELLNYFTTSQRDLISGFMNNREIPDGLFNQGFENKTDARHRILVSSHIITTGTYANSHNEEQRVEARMCGALVTLIMAYAGVGSSRNTDVRGNFDHEGNVVLHGGSVQSSHFGGSSNRDYLPLDRFDEIEPGDWLYIRANINHSVIFGGWQDERPRVRPIIEAGAGGSGGTTTADGEEEAAEQRVSFRRAITYDQRHNDRGEGGVRHEGTLLGDIPCRRPYVWAISAIFKPGDSSVATESQDLIPASFDLQAAIARNDILLEHFTISRDSATSHTRAENARLLPIVAANRPHGDQTSRLSPSQQSLLAHANESVILEELVILNQRLNVLAPLVTDLNTGRARQRQYSDNARGNEDTRAAGGYETSLINTTDAHWDSNQRVSYRGRIEDVRNIIPGITIRSTDRLDNIVSRHRTTERNRLRREARAERRRQREQPSTDSSQQQVDAAQPKMENAFVTSSNDIPIQRTEIPAGINIHENSSKANDVGALAYTQGSDIHFAPGEFNPSTTSGKELIGHELHHVKQQSDGRVQANAEVNGMPVNDNPGLEKEADDAGRKFAAGEASQLKLDGESLKSKAVQRKPHAGGCDCSDCSGKIQMKSDSSQVIQRVDRPANVRGMTFCGVSIPRARGVNPAMRTALTSVQTDLQSKYDELEEAEKPATFEDYCGVTEIKGWRDTTSQHGTGNAVDVNYTEHPYIATRTEEGERTTYGGEQGGATRQTRALRRPSVEVYDRAASFIRNEEAESSSAEVGARHTAETATDAYTRFKSASDSLKTYLGLVFLNGDENVRIDRRPVRNPEAATQEELLEAIPQSERYPQATALANIRAVMEEVAWISLHPDYPLTVDQQYTRILKDFEIVRKPMQYGNPSTNPVATRNPARGFLHFPEHFVVSMMDVGGMRWGACDFGGRSSGDVHHFDLAAAVHIAAPVATPVAEEPVGGTVDANASESGEATQQKRSESSSGHEDACGCESCVSQQKQQDNIQRSIIPSGVNIHKNSSEANDAGALAYTQGSNIHFAPGQFNPTTTSGKELIGHELHHVKQQSEGRVKANTEVNGMPVNDNPGLEKEADDAGRNFAKVKSGVQMKKEGHSSMEVGQLKGAVNQLDPDPTPTVATPKKSSKEILKGEFESYAGNEIEKFDQLAVFISSHTAARRGGVESSGKGKKKVTRKESGSVALIWSGSIDVAQADASQYLADIGYWQDLPRRQKKASEELYKAWEDPDGERLKDNRNSKLISEQKIESAMEASTKAEEQLTNYEVKLEQLNNELFPDSESVTELGEEKVELTRKQKKKLKKAKRSVVIARKKLDKLKAKLANFARNNENHEKVDGLLTEIISVTRSVFDPSGARAGHSSLKSMVKRAKGIGNNFAWSATTISYINWKAGMGNTFQYAESHTGYSQAANNSGGSMDFENAFGSSATTVGIGDILVRSRDSDKNKPADYGKLTGNTHGDIVLDILVYSALKTGKAKKKLKKSKRNDRTKIGTYAKVKRDFITNTFDSELEKSEDEQFKAYLEDKKYEVFAEVIGGNTSDFNMETGKKNGSGTVGKNYIPLTHDLKIAPDKAKNTGGGLQDYDTYIGAVKTNLPKKKPTAEITQPISGSANAGVGGAGQLKSNSSQPISNSSKQENTPNQKITQNAGEGLAQNSISNHSAIANDAEGNVSQRLEISTVASQKNVSPELTDFHTIIQKKSSEGTESKEGVNLEAYQIKNEIMQKKEDAANSTHNFQVDGNVVQNNLNPRENKWPAYSLDADKDLSNSIEKEGLQPNFNIQKKNTQNHSIPKNEYNKLPFHL